MVIFNRRLVKFNQTPAAALWKVKWVNWVKCVFPAKLETQQNRKMTQWDETKCTFMLIRIQNCHFAFRCNWFYPGLTIWGMGLQISAATCGNPEFFVTSQFKETPFGFESVANVSVRPPRPPQNVEYLSGNILHLYEINRGEAWWMYVCAGSTNSQLLVGSLCHIAFRNGLEF